MGVDHGETGTGPTELGQGGTLMQNIPQILSYSYKKKRSVAFKMLLKSVSGLFFPRLRWGSSRRSADPLVGWEGHPSPYFTPFGTDPLRRSPCVPKSPACRSTPVITWSEKLDLSWGGDLTPLIPPAYAPKLNCMFCGNLGVLWLVMSLRDPDIFRGHFSPEKSPPGSQNTANI